MQKRSSMTRSFRTRASLVLLILSAVLICDVGLGTASAQMGFGRFGSGFRPVPNEILVTTNAQLSSAGLQRLERRFGLTPLTSTRVELLGLEIRRYRLSDISSVRGSIVALRADPGIRSAQPNVLFAPNVSADLARQVLDETAAHPGEPMAPSAEPVQQVALIDALAGVKAMSLQ